MTMGSMSEGLEQKVYSLDARSFECCMCGKKHGNQMFISHARRDEELARAVAQSCCEVSVAPYLFECSLEVATNDSPAKAIAQKILDSDALIMLVSKGIEKHWIQAWIGFETGIVHGANTSANTQSNPRFHHPQRAIVLQSTEGRIDACIPWVDVLVLFDFSDENGWKQYKNLVMALALSDNTFFAGREFRENYLVANIQCTTCKSTYESWLAITNISENAKRISDWPMKVEMGIDCPSCEEPTTGCFTHPSQG